MSVPWNIAAKDNKTVKNVSENPAGGIKESLEIESQKIAFLQLSWRPEYIKIYSTWQTFNLISSVSLVITFYCW